MYVLKCRGTAHSNQVREFLITNAGVKLKEAYLGQGTVLTGSARLTQEARDEVERQGVREEAHRARMALAHRSKAVEAQIAALRAGFQADAEEYERVAASARRREQQMQRDRQAIAASRNVMNQKNHSVVK